MIILIMTSHSYVFTNKQWSTVSFKKREKSEECPCFNEKEDEEK